MPSTSKELRVGTVPYLVGRPLDHGLEQEAGIQLVRDVPARLVDGLRSGTLDVALVSSIELFRQPGYRYLDGLAVAADGYVGSVQVFLKRPIQEVQHIALDPASRASAALVQTLLFERKGGPPAFTEVPLGDDPREADGADAWLRIGDPALRETLTLDTPAWNPSENWRERTGLPFVFATWIVAPGVDVAPFVDAFGRARDRGRSDLDALADRAAREWRLPRSRCIEYLADECSYDPGAAMPKALMEFQRRASRAGLCDPSLAPEPISLR